MAGGAIRGICVSADPVGIAHQLGVARYGIRTCHDELAAKRVIVDRGVAEIGSANRRGSDGTRQKLASPAASARLQFGHFCRPRVARADGIPARFLQRSGSPSYRETYASPGHFPQL